MLFLSYCSN